MVDCRARVDFLDLLRGLAVCGFILWHTFDMLYLGNRYSEPFFRSVILTRVLFVMVSASVLGLQSTSGRKIGIFYKRSLMLISYPVMVGMIKAFVLKSWLPLQIILFYPLGGSDDFTFSILVALGIITLWLPWLLQHAFIIRVVLVVATTVCFLELAGVVAVPPFWSLMIVALLFGRFIRPLCHFLSASRQGGQFVVSLCAIMALILVACSEDYYWIIRDRVGLVVAFLFGFSVLINFLSVLLKLVAIKKALLYMSSYSLFIYFFHYVLLAGCVLLLGKESIDVLGVLSLAVVILFFSYLVVKYLRVVQLISKQIV